MEFSCLRCGYCCENLLLETPEQISGLRLYPDERDLFSKKVVAGKYQRLDIVLSEFDGYRIRIGFYDQNRSSGYVEGHMNVDRYLPTGFLGGCPGLSVICSILLVR